MSRRIHAIQWRDDGLVAVKFADGRVVAEADPTELAGMLEQFSVVEYQPWHRRLIFKFRDEYGFECELGTVKDPSPVRGRPVVYLDQNQWSTLSKSLFAPERVSDTERIAAVRLLKMAEAGDIILPLSSAHLSETGAWSNDAGRSELARTILAGSRGWQMRDVLEVRAEEFRHCLATLTGIDVAPPAPVMTLEPYAALDSSVRGEGDEVSLPADLPEAWRFGYLSTLSNTVYVACLLDREPTPRGSLAGWLARVQGFSSWLDGERQRSKSDRRKAARLFAAADATKEIAAAAAEIGSTPAQATKWFAGAWDQMSLGAPAITLFRSVMVDKMLAGARWEENDLTDLMYLCTAAGYADHVVGERRTIGLLQQSVRRLLHPVHLHTKLASVVRFLERGNRV
ncbi:hypothetical protein [uncultured Microbacterium sp.]|uniref:hypothetical protein n=1 Tax=uncultured Microbacterium sp. TaxID=191216 RepID=UPI002628780A|nr:hypothetical protein [uncultured Microbacterium sp.]